MTPELKPCPTFENIKAILEGIDKDELDSEQGWWETSEGARFGAKKLAEIERLFDDEKGGQQNKP